jgi:hypothetical protein
LRRICSSLIASTACGITVRVLPRELERGIQSRSPDVKASAGWYDWGPGYVRYWDGNRWQGEPREAGPRPTGPQPSTASRIFGGIALWIGLLGFFAAVLWAIVAAL